MPWKLGKTEREAWNSPRESIGPPRSNTPKESSAVSNSTFPNNNYSTNNHNISDPPLNCSMRKGTWIMPSTSRTHDTKHPKIPTAANFDRIVRSRAVLLYSFGGNLLGSPEGEARFLDPRHRNRRSATRRGGKRNQQTGYHRAVSHRHGGRNHPPHLPSFFRGLRKRRIRRGLHALRREPGYRAQHPRARGSEGRSGPNIGCFGHRLGRQEHRRGGDFPRIGHHALREAKPTLGAEHRQ